MQIEKMKSTARFWNTGMKVIGGIFGVCGIICAVFAVLVAILGEKVFVSGSFTMELGIITAHMAEDFPVNMEMMKWFACMGLVCVAVICLLVKRATIHLRAILTPMEEGRPFEPGTAERLRKIAWLTLIGGAVVQIISISEEILMTRIYPVASVFNAELVEKVEYNFKIDGGFLWAACLILFLSYIFSYGQSLQQESDETL